MIISPVAVTFVVFILVEPRAVIVPLFEFRLTAVILLLTTLLELKSLFNGAIIIARISLVFPAFCNLKLPTASNGTYHINVPLV